MIRRSEILAGQCFGNCEDGALIAYNTMGDDVLIQAHKLDSDNETQPVVLLNAKFIYDQAFQYQRLGYGSAVAWVLFLVIVALTLLAMRIARERVYYAAR